MEESSKGQRDDFFFSETCTKSDKTINYTITESNVISVTQSSQWNVLKKFSSLIKDVFLPKGYPESVSNDYLEYQIWDTCQAFCSSISGTLAMRAVMQGIGVGSETATPVSAAVTWLIKDGTGMIGSILFAWMKGSKLDSDCKKWRFFADVLNDIAMFIELSIPYKIEYSMQMMCTATVFKALVGTAGSSTRAAIITHQAIRGNIADVSAKDGSQEIFTNLCAFIFGIFILKNVTKTEHVWSVMYTATMFHLIFNYKAVKCLKMNIFNKERFCLSLRTYLPTSSVPTVEQVNRRESVFLCREITEAKICGFSFELGASLKKAMKSHELKPESLTLLYSLFQSKRYFIFPHVRKKKLYVSFHKNYRPYDVLKGYFHACLIAISLNYMLDEKDLHVIKRSRKNSPIYRLQNMLRGSQSFTMQLTFKEQTENFVLEAYTISDFFIEKEFDAFCSACDDQGWSLNKHLLNINDWRGDWKTKYYKKSKEIKFSVTNLAEKRSSQIRTQKPSSASKVDYLVIS